MRPGLSLVPTPEPEAAARDVALRVGATQVLNPAELAAAIARRERADGLRRARARERAARTALLSAVIAAEQAADAVPNTLVAADPVTVLAAARDTQRADAAAADAARAVGPRPLLDADHERDAIAAGVALEDAEHHQRSTRSNVQPTIAVGNAGGVFLLAVLVAGVIAGWIGLTSFVAATLLGLAALCPLIAIGVATIRVFDADRRRTAAAAALEGALVEVRFTSLEELACQRDALDAWNVRRRRAADVHAAAEAAAARWRELGCGIPPSEATAAVGRAEHARATHEAAELARLDHQLTLRALADTEVLADEPLVVCDPAGEVDRLLGLSTAVPVVLVTTDRCPLPIPAKGSRGTVLKVWHRRRRKRGG